MITARPEPTYAYMRDARGLCWAVCAFIKREGDILYAWTIRAMGDQDHRPTAKALLGRRLNKLYFGEGDRCIRSFRPYRGRACRASVVVQAVRSGYFDKLGIHEGTEGMFRAALNKVRERIAMLGVQPRIVTHYDPSTRSASAHPIPPASAEAVLAHKGKPAKEGTNDV